LNFITARSATLIYYPPSVSSLAFWLRSDIVGVQTGMSFRSVFSAKISIGAAAAILVAAAVLTQLFSPAVQIRQMAAYAFGTGNEASTTDPALVFGPRPALSNSDFFASVRQSFVDQKADFIEADLSSMVIRVYKGGAVVKEAPILAKGKEGSWWETPAGLYQIETKEPNHFSSFGDVNMPWSMEFQGNFFIHGWPSYPDGSPVSGSYSGGCIRLGDDDAKAIYDLAEKGMPVLVYEKDFSSDNFSYQAGGPQLGAAEYLAADLKDNYVFLSKGAETPVEIGSLADLVTAIVSAEYINLDNPIAFRGGTMSALNVLYPLLLQSSPDAADTLASRLGESYFVSVMNSKTKALGMNGTTLADSAGTGAGNVSTPEDMFNLAKYIYNNRSFIWAISTGKLTTSAYGSAVYADLPNDNEIPDMPMNLVGGKFSDAGEGKQSYVGVFDFNVGGETRPIVISVFDSPDAKADVIRIAEYIEANFR